MIKELKKKKNVDRTLGRNTLQMILITLISEICLTLTAIYAYTATDNPSHYELLRISDDLLEVTKSVAVVGLVGTLGFGYVEKE